MSLDILEIKMLETIKYTSNIITETTNCIKFAIAITDYIFRSIPVHFPAAY